MKNFLKGETPTLKKLIHNLTCKCQKRATKFPTSEQ